MTCSSTRTTPAERRSRDLRVQHGHREPHDVRLWGLGNEMDAPWQVGYATAEAYGLRATQTARAMRQVDPRIELVACGSSSRDMPTFGAWEAAVLEHAYDDVDFISVHGYYEERDGDLASFLASSVDMDEHIRAVIATADAVRARRGSSARGSTWPSTSGTSGTSTDFAGHTKLDLERTPRLIEDTFSVADAVAVGGLPQRLPAPRRPGQDRLPGAAGQRHRAACARRSTGRRGSRRSSTRSRTPPGWPAAPPCAWSPRGLGTRRRQFGEVDSRRRQRHLGRGDRRRRAVPRQPASERARRGHRRRPRLRGPAGERVPAPRGRRPAPHQHRSPARMPFSRSRTPASASKGGASSCG